MLFRFLTSGESHGQCLNAIIDGVPAGFDIEESYINKELARRQCGYGRGGRMQIEKDTAKILSGVRLGKSIGSPVCLEIKNKDWENWQVAMSVSCPDLTEQNKATLQEKKITKLRPGHADFAGMIKYDQEDVRNILERSSARETATRVAVGAVAKSILENFGIIGFSHVTQIGKVEVNYCDRTKLDLDRISASELLCCDKTITELMKQEIDKAKESGDTLGGSFEVIFKNLPIGLGSHVHWDRKIDGLLAQAIMSIPAVKSVEFGLGKDVAHRFGSQTHDEIFYEENKYHRKTNNAGGVEGGMTNGEDIVIKVAMKAIPTMKKPLKSVCCETHDQYDAHFERSDVCAVPACAVVAENMAAIILLDLFLQKFGNDNKSQITSNYNEYLKMLSER